jgi:hypothetical protein
MLTLQVGGLAGADLHDAPDRHGGWGMTNGCSWTAASVACADGASWSMMTS